MWRRTTAPQQKSVEVSQPLRSFLCLCELLNFSRKRKYPEKHFFEVPLTCFYPKPSAIFWMISVVITPEDVYDRRRVRCKNGGLRQKINYGRSRSCLRHHPPSPPPCTRDTRAQERNSSRQGRGYRIPSVREHRHTPQPRSR